jgi:hypothetical protein
MVLVQVPARDMIVQILADDATTWVAVGGLKNIKLDPSANGEMEETTTYGSAGAYEEVPMQRGALIELEGAYLEDNITGAQDTGQALCETRGTAVGYAGVGKVRFRHPLATTWRVWTTPGATFELSDQGGGNNNMISWGAKIRRSGVTTTAAVA